MFKYGCLFNVNQIIKLFTCTYRQVDRVSTYLKQYYNILYEVCVYINHSVLSSKVIPRTFTIFTYSYSFKLPIVKYIFIYINMFYVNVILTYRMCCRSYIA